jgi:hypothetical protein
VQNYSYILPSIYPHTYSYIRTYCLQVTLIHKLLLHSIYPYTFIHTAFQLPSNIHTYCLSYTLIHTYSTYCLPSTLIHAHVLCRWYVIKRYSILHTVRHTEVHVILRVLSQNGTCMDKWGANFRNQKNSLHQFVDKGLKRKLYSRSKVTNRSLIKQMLFNLKNIYCTSFQKLLSNTYLRSSIVCCILRRGFVMSP